MKKKKKELLRFLILSKVFPDNHKAVLRRSDQESLPEPCVFEVSKDAGEGPSLTHITQPSSPHHEGQSWTAHIQLIPPQPTPSPLVSIAYCESKMYSFHPLMVAPQDDLPSSLAWTKAVLPLWCSYIPHSLPILPLTADSIFKVIQFFFNVNLIDLNINFSASRIFNILINSYHIQNENKPLTMTYKAVYELVSSPLDYPLISISTLLSLLSMQLYELFTVHRTLQLRHILGNLHFQFH